MIDVKLEWSGDLETERPRRLPPRAPGVYIWAHGSTDRMRLSYVGQSTDLKNRFHRHLIDMLGGASWLYDPDSLMKGSLSPVYKSGVDEFFRDFLPNLPEKLELARRNVSAYHFFWALTREDKLIRESVESALIQNARNSNVEIQNSRLSRIPKRAPSMTIISRLPAGVQIRGLNRSMRYGVG